VARRRVELVCRLDAEHEGPHRDAEHGEVWDSVPGETTLLFRHEDDD